MREVNMNGKKRLVFVVTDGEANIVVIPVENLSPIDYRRLSDMSSKGGELMSIMRDTKLDNGMNALNQYKDLFEVVPKEVKVVEKSVSGENESKLSNTPEGREAAIQGTEVPPQRRGRGRPRSNS